MYRGEPSDNFYSAVTNLLDVLHEELPLEIKQRPKVIEAIKDIIVASSEDTDVCMTNIAKELDVRMN